VELDRLRNEIMAGRGPVVVIGIPGAGKTELCRSLEPALAGLAYTALVSGPAASEADLVERILNGFGLSAPSEAPSGGDGSPSKGQLVQVLRRFLAGLSSVGARAVVVIDDAHCLTEGVLAIIADLASLEANGRSMLQFVLVGRPELRDLLAAPEQAILDRRVSARCQIEAAPPEIHPVPAVAQRRGASLATAATVVLLGSATGAGLMALLYQRLGF
jgi:type II secretory pathway predicted ATPase ExeA